MAIADQLNFWEGMLWIAIATWFFVDAVRVTTKNRWFCVISGGLFLMFGLSDFVEMRTGNWWCPWWLLTWKVGCILGFLTMYIWYRKLGKRKRQ